MDLKNIVSKIPNKPGIYKYLDSDGKIIYIGKAKDLKKRVKSYFVQNKQTTPKLKVLVSKITDIEYIVVNSDLEAIMLETNLIKEIKPKYNVLMKDDKNFVYLKITTNQDFPKIYLTRKILKDKATYFGPKTSGYDLKNTIKLISNLLPYPKCQINIEWLKTFDIKKSQEVKPVCVFKQIDPDHKPCIADLPKDQYNQMIQLIIEFFSGKHTNIIKNLEQEMLKLATNKNFEQAAILRDRLESLKNTTEKQNISGTKHEQADVIDIVFSHNKYYANLFQIREGKLVSQENFTLSENGLSENIDEAMQEVFVSFLSQYYSETNDFPKEILIPEPLSNKSELEQLISSYKDGPVKIIVPKIGKKHELICLATKNAEQYAKLMKVKWLSTEARASQQVLPSLKEVLNLKKNPKRIECYDISHLQGNHTIGSMIVFENGASKKSDYRYFNIKSLKKGDINDFESLNEVLSRRLKYISNLPDQLQYKKFKQTFQLVHKKSKKSYIQVNFEQEQEVINLELLQKSEKYCLKNIQTFENFIKKIILKNKAKKYLINLSDKDLKQSLLAVGFIEIDNPNYNLGYYPNKQIFDKSFTSKPDLIVIDGGKGQLSAVLKAKKQLGINIPFVSIAKKEEIIHTEDKKEIILPKNSPVLNLIQQMRDEAHRFAITKNRKDRIKEMLEQ